jgi:hypothetical protein
MKFALPLNQMLALVARGLCKSQVVMMFFGTVYLWLHPWFPVVVVLRLLALKKNGRGVFVVCNDSQRFVE